MNFRDFIAEMQNPPPFLMLISKTPSNPTLRWVEEDLMPPKTEQELLRENIQREWDW